MREPHVDRGHPVDGLGGSHDLVGELVLQRTAGNRQSDEDADLPRLGHLEVADHVELPERAVQLRILHFLDGRPDGCGIDHDASPISVVNRKL